MQECMFCGKKADWVCMNTREMEDAASEPLCYAALMFAGGGEYTHNQHQSQLLRQLSDRRRK